MKTLLLILSMTMSGAAMAQSSAVVNQLRPFTSDGCSSFPDGIPYFNGTLWLACCVKHDVAYWQGGTYEQKVRADEELRQCVGQKTFGVFGRAMESGVWVGGSPKLKTTWAWGYGWKIPFGYRELNAEERAQVTELAKEIPADLAKVKIINPGTLAQRGTVTGDYCLDTTLIAIEKEHGRGLGNYRREVLERRTERGEERTYFIWPEGCEEPYQVSFLVKGFDHCRTPVTELMAGSHLKILEMKPAPNCR